MKFNIRGTQKLTDDGKLGVGLMFISPLASGFIWAWLTYGNVKGGSAFLPSVLLGVSGLAFLYGIVLFVLGRAYHFTAHAEKTDSAA